MRIVCPKCELKGQVDVAPSGAKTRIACVRCATTFEAVFTDDQVQVVQPQSQPSEPVLESAVNAVSTAISEYEPAFEPSQETQAVAAPLQITASAPASEEDFSLSSPDLISEEMTAPTPESLQMAFNEFTRKSAETQSSPTTVDVEPADDAATATAAAAAASSNTAVKVSRPPTDAYGVGVRLMRVSPMWLLLAGLSFISFIVLCNWLVKPVGKAADAAGIPASNHATNQSVDRGDASTAITSPVNTQPVRPAAEGSGVAFVETEAKEEAPAAPQVAPSVEAVKEAPKVEEKPATAQGPSTEAAARGRVTIQIGSYNEAAQADERVANLKSAGFDARSVAVEIPKRGTWYRVQSGRFASRDEAERYGRQLRDKGVVANFITTDTQE